MIKKLKKIFSKKIIILAKYKNNVLHIIKTFIIKYIKQIDKMGYSQYSKLVTSDDNNHHKQLYSLFRLALVFILLIFLVNIFVNKISKPGEWGDFFGGVLNPILTFITFMALLMTIIIQQNELKETKKVFEGQEKALDDQHKEMIKQTFDNKFFKMLNQLNDISSSFAGTRNNFSELFDNFENHLVKAYKGNDNIKITNLNFFYNGFQTFNDSYDTSFKYYYINLYQVLKYIDGEIEDITEAKKYTNIVRAKLSKFETLLLFYNAIGVIKYNGTKYKHLVEKYALFEHLKYTDFNVNIHKDGTFRRQKLCTINLLLTEYDISAYGKNDTLVTQINNIK